MEIEEQRYQEEMSLASNPRFGTQKPTAVLRVFKIMVGFIFSHLPGGVMKQDSGVEEGSWWALRWSTFRRSSTLGHNIGSTDALCPIPPSPDAILMGCERQRDKVGGLEITCHGCGRKDTASATEVSIFETELGAL